MYNDISLLALRGVIQHHGDSAVRTTRRDVTTVTLIRQIKSYKSNFLLIFLTNVRTCYKDKGAEYGIILLCACALEPVPCIALRDIGTGFLFSLFAVENGVRKSCKTIRKAKRKSRIKDAFFVRCAASTQSFGCCLQRRSRIRLLNVNGAVKKAL